MRSGEKLIDGEGRNRMQVPSFAGLPECVTSRGPYAKECAMSGQRAKLIGTGICQSLIIGRLVFTLLTEGTQCSNDQWNIHLRGS